MGEWDTGIATCERALAGAPDPLNRAIAMGWLGYSYLQKGETGKAIAVLEESVEHVRLFRFREFEGWFTVFLADAHRSEGRLDRARELALQGLEVSVGANFAAGIGWARQALGRIAHATGDLSEAETHLEEARQIFTSTHSRYELARTCLDLAAVTHAQGRAESAQAHLGEAHRLFRAMDAPKYVERTEQLARDLGVALSA
jgi:tetratricopeptide (TPR) repeat protein